MRSNYLGTSFCVALGLFCIYAMFSYKLAFNITSSLPGKLYLVARRAEVRKGDVVEATPAATANTPKGVSHLKIVRGVPGDRVWHSGNRVLINGEDIGLVKVTSLNGRILEPGFRGVIPDGRYFLWTPHEDSYDSRYAEVGLYSGWQILGVATHFWGKR